MDKIHTSKDSINKKTKFLFACILIVGMFSFMYLLSSSFHTNVNKRWNYAYMRITTVLRNFYLSQIKDESPGVGPGNAPVSIQDPNHFSFAILGDTQMFDFPNATGGFKKAVDQITKMKPGLVMTVGDLIQGCNTSDKCMNYKLWKNIAKAILPITYEVVGNHDRIVGNSDVHKKAADKAWQSYFNVPTNGPLGYEKFVYSFDAGNSHFVILDTEKPKEHEVRQDQLDWLENDLANNKKDNTFIFYHEPAFPMSYKIGQSLDVHKDMRDALWTILDKYNVTAVFNGHEHIFSRQSIGADEFLVAKNKIFQFIIGNTDATEKNNVQIGSQVNYYNQGHDFVMVDVNGKEITIRLFSVDGVMIDSFTFSH